MPIIITQPAIAIGIPAVWEKKPKPK